MNSLAAYLQLETLALRLLANDDDLADRVREVLDFIWVNRLTAEERDWLDGRGLAAKP